MASKETSSSTPGAEWWGGSYRRGDFWAGVSQSQQGQPWWVIGSDVVTHDGELGSVLIPQLAVSPRWAPRSPVLPTSCVLGQCCDFHSLRAWDSLVLGTARGHGAGGETGVQSGHPLTGR